MLGYIGLMIKGALFGIANIIPGVSGGTIAVITGIYEKLLNAINNIFKDFKKSFIFLMVFGIGSLIATLAGAKGVDWCINNALFPTSCLFIGLILGGVPVIYSPVRDSLNMKNKGKSLLYILIFIICFAFVISLLFLPKNKDLEITFEDYIMLGLCGILASAAMIIPGISGMMMFYLFGYYELIMNSLSGLLSFEFSTMLHSLLLLLPVLVGILIGLFTTAKLLGFLFKRFKTGTYFGILGFIFASVCAILFNLIHSDYETLLFESTSTIILSISTLILGFVATYFMSRLERKKNNMSLEE